MAAEVTQINSYFPDNTGEPTNNAYIYIGTSGLDPVNNPISVFWDAALSIAATQPIRTSGGFPVKNGSPASLYISGSTYSILLQDEEERDLRSNLTATNEVSSLDSRITTLEGLVDQDVTANSTTSLFNALNVASGDLGLGIAIADTKLHVHNGAAGAVAASAGSVLTVENNATAYIQFLTPNTDSSGLLFGDPESTAVGALTYAHTTNKATITANGSAVFTVDGPNERIGVNTASPIATCHVDTSDSGVSLSTSADDLFVEAGSNAGITIGCPNTSTGSLLFADPDHDDRGGITYDHATDDLLLRAASSPRVQINSDGDALPGTTAVQDLGSVALEWDNLFVTNSPTVSDERRKEDIEPISGATALLKAVTPVTYVYKDRVIPATDTSPERVVSHTRPHTGFIAQSVKQAMNACGIEDWAGYAYEEEADLHMLRLNEFIGYLVAGFQELESRVSELETV